MILKNKLDQSFGSSGSTAGHLLFFAGLVTMYYSNVGLILFLLCGFIGFTYTNTWFDSDKKRILFSENVFALFLLCKWIDVEPEMILKIEKRKKGFQVFIQSNIMFPPKRFFLTLFCSTANNYRYFCFH